MKSTELLSVIFLRVHTIRRINSFDTFLFHQVLVSVKNFLSTEAERFGSDGTNPRFVRAPMLRSRFEHGHVEAWVDSV